MPRGRKIAARTGLSLRSSYPHPDSRQPTAIEIDIDPPIDEHQDTVDTPMSDKATPFQRGPVMYHGDTAHTKQANLEDLSGWQAEIHNRIREYPTNLKTYLRQMVPSARRVPPCPPVGPHFQEIPLGNFEATMYPPMVKALTKLVQDFPEDKRPTFHNYEHKIMKFPFHPYEREQHPTKPDIIATIPAIPVVTPLYRWRHIAVVFEVKSQPTDDPMKKHTMTHWETLVQLAKSARNIMLSQGRLFVFVVGIYGELARLFRFDRAGAICSRAFDYRDEPQILHEFLWRLFHPKLAGCDIVGADPTMELGTAEDRELAEQWAEKSDPDWARTAETRKAVRRITITKGQDKTRYLTYKLLFVNPRLFSRATLVWEAFNLDDEALTTDERRRYVLKETWGGLARVSETKHYEALQSARDGQEATGIAKFIHGDDLGHNEEIARVEEEKARKPKSRVPRVVRPGHLTVAGVHHTPKKERLNERSHTRIVLETVGTPLHDFMSTRELVVSLRDAIDGHWRAYNDGVIHRDISEGNVMIARDAKTGRSRGFIQDFDYSFSWKQFLRKRNWGNILAAWEKYCVEHGHEPRSERNPDNDSKERTGTFFFMAIEIIEDEITHEARHDLESFYWLLVFIVLRHTVHSHPLKNGAFGNLFCHAQMEICAKVKIGWLTSKKAKPPVTVPGNEPLTELLERFRILCSRNFAQVNGEVQRMTHQQVLEIFDDVLAADKVWPTDDAACPWVPPVNVSYTADMVESLGQSMMQGTLDHTTADDTRFPRFRAAKSDSNYERSEDERNEEDTDEQSSEDDVGEASVPADAEERVPDNEDSRRTVLAAAQEEPVFATSKDQPQAGTSRSTRSGARNQARDGRAGRRPAQLPAGARHPPSRNEGRSVAETWPASNADGAGARPGQRYNLRSSSRRDQAAASSLDAGVPAPAPGRMVTRSRAQTTSRPRDTGARDGSVGKRSRAGEELDDVELGPESHSSKRQRTLSQPRGRKLSKKSGKKS